MSRFAEAKLSGYRRNRYLCTKLHRSQDIGFADEEALPLAGGLGGYRAPREMTCTQTKPSAKFNKTKEIRRSGFLHFICATQCATSFVRSTTSFATGNIICAKHNILCRRQHHLCEAQHHLPQETSFVRSTTSFAAGNIICAKHNITRKRCQGSVNYRMLIVKILRFMPMTRIPMLILDAVVNEINKSVLRKRICLRIFNAVFMCQYVIDLILVLL